MIEADRRGSSGLAEPASREDSGTLPAVLRRPPSAETLLVYEQDWTAFRSWCRGQDLPSLPTTAEALAVYLDAGVGHFRPGTLTRHLAAIATHHIRHGFSSPVDATLRRKLRDLHRADQTRRFAAPPTDEQLQRMATHCPGDLAGKRDRALLLLAAASVILTAPGKISARTPTAGVPSKTRLGRSALVGLDVDDIRFTDAGRANGVDDVPRDLPPSRHPPANAGSADASRRIVPGGVELRLRRFGRRGPQLIWLERQVIRSNCPVSALEDWLWVSDSAFGPVFRKIDRWGNLEHRRLGTDAIRRIWQRRTPRSTRRVPKPAQLAQVA